jgi:hypothetical protein
VLLNVIILSVAFFIVILKLSIVMLRIIYAAYQYTAEFGLCQALLSGAVMLSVDYAKNHYAEYHKC